MDSRAFGQDLLVGIELGHYRIVEKIGAGGMGEVYRAHDQRLDRDVALKILPAGVLSGEDGRRRFRMEARALSKLNHPNIAVVHDFDCQDGIDFLVMEYVEGKSLLGVLETGALPEKEIAVLGAQIAEALEEAHEHGVVHRDLKPGNILVTPKGRAKVIDFGLAKFLHPASGLAATESFVEVGFFAGTLPYMSPEQLLGEPPDARSDIFSFGAVLYEMATGQRPFQAKVPTALAEDIIHKPTPPPVRLRPEISQSLEQIIVKCLAKDPSYRYQTAKELAVDLRRLALPTRVAEAEVKSGRRISHPRRLIAAALLITTTIVLGLIASKLRQRWIASGTERIESLAVLPIENLSGDPAQDYFADGMTEALITDLANIGVPRVISRTSMMQYKGTRKSLPEIANELNVDGVLEGSILRFGDRVRVTAQLIYARKDRHIWAHAYDRNERDILTLQNEVAQAIANAIKLEISAASRARLANSYPVHPEAHEAYLRGRYFWNRRTEEDLTKAQDYFEQAIAKDPEFAPAYSGLADTYFYRGYAFGHLPPHEAMPLAKAASVKSLQLDDGLAEGHTSLALIKMFYDWDFSGAEQEFKRAIALNPNYATAHHAYAVLLFAMGRPNESIAEARKAMEVDPLSMPVNNILGAMLANAGHCDEAIVQYHRMLEMDPNMGMAHGGLASCYEEQGMHKEALEEQVKARLADGDTPQEIEEFRKTYAALGKKGVLNKDLQAELASWKKDHWHVDAWKIAMDYAEIGNKDEAFAWIDKAIQLRSGMLVWLYVGDNPLRSDPRFQDVKHRMGI